MWFKNINNNYNMMNINNKKIRFSSVQLFLKKKRREELIYYKLMLLIILLQVQ
jgi:hypothetical protein